MAAPALSASYVRPAPTLACALQNVFRGSKKSLQSVSVMEVGIAPRGAVGDAPSNLQDGAFGSFEKMSRRGFCVEQQCRGWSTRSSSRGMRVQASAAAVETAESPKVRLDSSLCINGGFCRLSPCNHALWKQISYLLFGFCKAEEVKMSLAIALV